MDTFEPGQQRNPNPNASLPPGLLKKVLFGVIAAVLVWAGWSSFYTVKEHESAAVVTFGQITSEVGAGLHFKWPDPIQKVIILPTKLTQSLSIGYREVGNQTVVVEEESLMITGDENIISADAVVLWNIHNIHDYLYNIDNPEKFLRNSASSAIRAVIGSKKLDYAITDGKTEIQAEVKEYLLDLHERYKTGIHIIDVKFQDIEPPGGEVEEAFREVTNAREEKNTKINVAEKYTNERIPKARGEADKIINEAEAQKLSRVLAAQGDVAKFNALYAEYVKNPQVTEKRIILETLEQILPNAKIFISDSSGDTVKYLPINELLRPTGNASGSAAAQGGTTP